MQKIRYPEYGAHKEEHDRFMTKIDAYRHELETGSIVLNTEIMRQFMNWLQNHILSTDKKYGEFYLAMQK